MSKNKDFIKFLIVMLVFMTGMIFLIANHIHTWWIWAIYITIWTLAEMKIAKNFHLKWWVWVLILAGLSVIDLIVIRIFS